MRVFFCFFIFHFHKLLTTSLKHFAIPITTCITCICSSHPLTKWSFWNSSCCRHWLKEKLRAFYYVLCLVNTVIDDVSYLVSVCSVICAPIVGGPPSVPTCNLAQRKVLYGFWHVCLSCLCFHVTLLEEFSHHVFYTCMVLAYTAIGVSCFFVCVCVCTCVSACGCRTIDRHGSSLLN